MRMTRLWAAMMIWSVTGIVFAVAALLAVALIPFSAVAGAAVAVGLTLGGLVLGLRLACWWIDRG